MEKVKIVVDGKELEVEKGKTVLKAALENGINIPYFCYHPRLKIIGACRMCIAYNEKTGRLFTTCNTPVEDGMIISTKHPSVVVNQKYLLQALMTRHPLDCPICDKAGECDLQNYGAMFGPQQQIVPISALEKDRHYVDWESDFLEYYTNRCVVCYRCTRACSDVVGANALYVEERGFHANIAPTVKPFDTSSCEMCGLCVHVCPVGAIISKPFKYWTRSWLLQKDKTACNLCPVGCEIQVEYGIGDWKSEQKVYRTKPTDELNICSKAFLGYDAINYERLLKPIAYGKEVGIGEAVNFLSISIRDGFEKTAIILSNFLSNEVLDAIYRVSKASGCYVTSTLTLDMAEFLEGYGEYQEPSIENVKNASTYVLLGEDITSTSPVLSYYIKGNVYTLDNKRVRDKKLNPELITWEKLEDLKDYIAIVNTTGLENAKEWGKKLRGKKVLLLHYGSNSLGVYKRFKDHLSHLDSVLDAIEKGKVKNLIIFGEDILDYYNYLEIKNTLSKVEKLIVFSPFLDGLSSIAHIKIPMTLYGEADGTIDSLMKDNRLKSFLPWRFDEKTFYEYLVSDLPAQDKGIPVIKGWANGKNYTKPELHIYRSNWILKRSKNLEALYDKQVEIKV